MWNTHTLLTHGRCGIHTHTYHTTHTEEYYSPMEENDEWIKKMWNTHTCTHTQEYYSPIEENDEWIKKMWNTHSGILLTRGRCGIHRHTHTHTHTGILLTHGRK